MKSDWDYDDIASAYLEETVKSRDEFLEQEVRNRHPEQESRGKSPRRREADRMTPMRTAEFRGFPFVAAIRRKRHFCAYKPLSEKLAEGGMTISSEIEMPLVYIAGVYGKDGILASREELKNTVTV